MAALLDAFHGVALATWFGFLTGVFIRVFAFACGARTPRLRTWKQVGGIWLALATLIIVGTVNDSPVVAGMSLIGLAMTTFALAARRGPVDRWLFRLAHGNNVPLDY